ncbi:MAG TPA: ABC transporter substrate-binding protein [Xanthobacteraceae bacterium]|jgi:NitT/TauT family transport system substrate-binding protein
MKRATCLITALALALAAAMATAVPARAETKIRFSLDWIPGSVHAPFFIALYKGYYKAEGLDVSIERGKGSAELVRQLASGVYDMGYPDISVVTDFDSKNPDKAFPELLMGYEQAPAAIVFLKSSGITKPKQLEGKKLGSAANDATFKLFPIFAQHAGIDAGKVTIQYIEPKLREVLLAKHDVDAIPGQIFNAILELKAKGVKEEDVGSFLYRDYGLDLYGNGVAASRDFLKANPDAVRGFIRATVKGFQEMAADPGLALAMTLKFEPLLNADIERDRLKLASSCCIITPNVRQQGFGGIDEVRLKRGIALITQGYGLPREPGAREVFDPSFLPAQKDRMVK